LSKLESAWLKASKKKNEKPMSFFLQKKPPPVPPADKDTSPGAASAAAVCENAAESSQEECLGPVKSDPWNRSCEGIYPEYQKKLFQEQINAFVQYASTDANSLYLPNIVGNSGLTNLFMRTCAGMGTLRKTKNGNIHSCDSCHIDFYVSL
jgi:hypothetical protein